MYNISDKDVYLKRMRVGMYDKCWWVDKLYPEVDTVIDFGCADGSLWEAIKTFCPQITKYCPNCGANMEETNGKEEIL